MVAWRLREIEGGLSFCRRDGPQCRSVAHTTVPIALGMPNSIPALARVRGHQIVLLRVKRKTRSTDLGSKSLREGREEEGRRARRSGRQICDHIDAVPDQDAPSSSDMARSPMYAARALPMRRSRVGTLRLVAYTQSSSLHLSHQARITR